MWEFWLSVLTVFLSCVAICINIYQNRETKKQNLFDRRIRLYLEFKDLFELYKNNKRFLKNIDPLSVDMEFSFLTNSSKLYMLADIMNTPLNQAKKVAFLTACESMRKDAQEFRFVFNNKKYLKLANFIEDYVELLEKLHQQQVLIKNLERQSEISLARKNKPFELDYVEEKCNKLAQEENGLFSIIKKIQQIYENIEKEKLLDKLEKEIKF